MKIQIVSQNGGHTGARLLIEGALLRLPDHIKRVMPDILMKIVPFEGLPHSARCKWGLRAAPARTNPENWAIRNTTGASGPHTISVFLLEENGGEEDRHFQRDIISAILECGFTQTPIVRVVESVIREYPRYKTKYKPRSIFVPEFTRFLLIPEILELEEPELMPLFKRLDQEILKLAEPVHAS